MSLLADIAATWRDPAAAMRGAADGPVREDRALATLMLAMALMYLARLPDLARQAAIDPAVPLDARMGITLFAMLFVVPLFAYAVAFASHLTLTALGRPGRAYGARLALFRALLAISPAVLAQGVLVGLAGAANPAARLAGVVVFGLFLWVWLKSLAAARPAGVRP